MSKNDELPKIEIRQTPIAGNPERFITFASFEDMNAWLSSHPPDPRDIAAAAGYYRHIDIERLTADLRAEPGCEDLQPRSLQNYLARKTKMPYAVVLAFAKLTRQTVETIMRAVK